MTSEIGISVLVISDLDRFLSMRDFWDLELQDHVSDPFLFGSMLAEHWKISRRLGWFPFLMVFLSEHKIVGFAPLIITSNFAFRRVSNFDQYTCPEFFSDSYREICVDKMISFLFGQLKCEVADITFEDESADQRMLEKVCRKRNLTCTKLPQEGQAIIPIETSLDSFRQTLDRKDRKELHRIGRKLDKLGSWQISCFDLDRSSLEKIQAVERFSWKANLKGKEKAIKELGLESILRGVQRYSQDKSLFQSEVWTLELNKVPIAYVLTMRRNETLLFAKTSYDSRYRNVSPGMFLMNDLIERAFRNKTAEKIDFISNIPAVRVWKPLVKKRFMFRITRNEFLSKVHLFVFENRISKKPLQILEHFKWEKKAGLDLLHY